MKRPGDDSPDPPGGRSAERLREFLRERQTPGDQPGNTSTPEDVTAPTVAPKTRSIKRRPAKHPTRASRKPGK